MVTDLVKNELLNELEEEFTVSAEAINFFQEFGYVKLKHVLSAEVLEYYGKLITDQVIRLNTLTKPMEERTTYERAFLQVMNLWRENDEVKTFVFSKRLAKIAADLLQVNGVRLYHDQALYKEPGGGITPWHADQFYWPLASPKTVTVWIPLQETPMEMGPLAFAEKSQTVEIGRTLEISDESERLMNEALEQFNLQESPFDLGEVSYHAGWLFHRAGANVSEEPRRVMTMIYMDQDQIVKNPVNSYQVEDWKVWLDSKEIGTVPDSFLNPVLFSR